MNGPPRRCRLPPLRRPQKGFVEQVYGLTLIGAADGRTASCSVTGEGHSGPPGVQPDRDALFYAVEKHRLANEGYVAGLEPGPTFPTTAVRTGLRPVPQLAPQDPGRAHSMSPSWTRERRPAGRRDDRSLQNGHTIMVHKEPETLGNSVRGHRPGIVSTQPEPALIDQLGFSSSPSSFRKMNWRPSFVPSSSCWKITARPSSGRVAKYSRALAAASARES